MQRVQDLVAALTGGARASDWRRARAPRRCPFTAMAANAGTAAALKLGGDAVLERVYGAARDKTHRAAEHLVVDTVVQAASAETEDERRRFDDDPDGDSVRDATLLEGWKAMINCPNDATWPALRHMTIEYWADRRTVDGFFHDASEVLVQCDAATLIGIAALLGKAASVRAEIDRHHRVTINHKRSSRGKELPFTTPHELEGVKHFPTCHREPTCNVRCGWSARTGSATSPGTRSASNTRTATDAPGCSPTFAAASAATPRRRPWPSMLMSRDAITVVARLALVAGVLACSSDERGRPAPTPTPERPQPTAVAALPDTPAVEAPPQWWCWLGRLDPGGGEPSSPTSDCEKSRDSCLAMYEMGRAEWGSMLTITMPCSQQTNAWCFTSAPQTHCMADAASCDDMQRIYAARRPNVTGCIVTTLAGP